MRFKLDHEVKLILILLLGLLIICLATYGGLRLYQDVNPTYSQELTEKAYMDVIDDKVNLVFYKTSCPYCRAAKKEIAQASKQSTVSTFFINLDTEEGQSLVKQYNIQKAATVVKIRQGFVEKFIYSKKVNGQYQADKAVIEGVFDDEEIEEIEVIE